MRERMAAALNGGELARDGDKGGRVLA